jgi:hypothetical protein
MKEGAERTGHQRDALVDGWFSQIAQAEIKPLRNAGLARPLGTDRQHSGRRVHADDVSTGERDRNRDSPCSDRELHDLATGRERLVDVEGDVFDDARAPRVVELCDGVVDAQGLRAT